MGLTWILVVIVGCVGLAGCIVAVLMRPMADERRRLRPLANAGRLTRLPEYVRAVRARTRAAVVTIGLLVVMFGAAIVVGARPTGLPTAAEKSGAGDPEDIMLCIGGPPSDPAASAALNYFAGQVDGFGTQRIGLTSPNRRVIPLTRDYQYAKQTLSDYARPAGDRGDVAAFAPGVTYTDYSEDARDTLALCLTGFPGFDQAAAQRRSVIYVGPDAPRRPDARGPALFTADAVRDLAVAAGVQVNTVITGPDSGALSSMARDTGGRSFPAGANMSLSLNDIRDHPPTARFTEGDGESGRPPESPDVPALIALAAAVALAGWPMVQRR
ncbi:hypothetical protein TUM20985_54670 [Mycobacterium antarcticum]|uniref:hypothetical protein n=1 Tax=Mycolicibacterium sp. TUM20985 TaxID=3023370 RepID=UPI002573A352|nr:hypothetical protein [Mycolicibacterium sp. TUM20985]BDX34920.1 hypothetical protein TUM20985_54670 [Mycolicibacterium sp. TUM20985]